MIIHNLREYSMTGIIRKFCLTKITIISKETKADVLQPIEEVRNSISQFFPCLSAAVLFQQHLCAKLVKLSR